MAELEELEQEDLDEKLLDVGPISDNLPAVPSTEPQPAKKGSFFCCSFVFLDVSLNQPIPCSTITE